MAPPDLPHQTLETAITRLSELGIVVARSSFYETDPVVMPAQPRFVMPPPRCGRSARTGRVAGENAGD